MRLFQFIGLWLLIQLGVTGCATLQHYKKIPISDKIEPYSEPIIIQPEVTPMEGDGIQENF